MSKRLGEGQGTLRSQAQRATPRQALLTLPSSSLECLYRTHTITAIMKQQCVESLMTATTALSLHLDRIMTWKHRMYCKCRELASRHKFCGHTWLNCTVSEESCRVGRSGARSAAEECLRMWEHMRRFFSWFVTGTSSASRAQTGLWSESITSTQALYRVALTTTSFTGACVSQDNIIKSTLKKGREWFKHHKTRVIYAFRTNVRGCGSKCLAVSPHMSGNNLVRQRVWCFRISSWVHGKTQMACTSKAATEAWSIHMDCVSHMGLMDCESISWSQKPLYSSCPCHCLLSLTLSSSEPLPFPVI